jgi:phosphoglycolate phosphatase-like HAD superfamily hydrolase
LLLVLEILNPNIARGRIRHALFDFDGTLSLIREGWQGVMIPMMVGLLRATPEAEDEAQIEAVVRDYVARLTGKQTIYQMIQLAEEIGKRQGAPLDPLEYKHMYLAQLNDRIAGRIEGLKAGRIAPDELMVPGSRAMLDALRERGIRCYLASGTDEPFVRDEAAALGLTPYFAGIYGAKDDYKSFSKRLVIDRIIAAHGLAGPEFVAFGDGYVEIEDTKRVGGIAVGLATDEARRVGVDEWKRNRLIEAGADVIAPDFCQREGILAYLWGE